MDKIFNANELYSKHVSYLSLDEIRAAIRFWLLHYHQVLPNEVLITLLDPVSDWEEIEQDKWACVTLSQRGPDDRRANQRESGYNPKNTVEL